MAMRIVFGMLISCMVGCGNDARYNGDPPAATSPAREVNVAETQMATMTMPAANIERRTIYFSGTVQGVGFRATTANLAEGLPVSGEVRNLPDGRVELVVEGAPGDIDRLVKKIREQFGAYVRSIEQSSSPAKGMPRGVRITY
jgi:acylphosphatase